MLLLGLPTQGAEISGSGNVSVLERSSARTAYSQGCSPGLKYLSKNLPIPRKPSAPLFCFPRITANRITLAALIAFYAILSLHQEPRLRVAYGELFELYREVPFLAPRLRR